MKYSVHANILLIFCKRGKVFFRAILIPSYFKHLIFNIYFLLIDVPVFRMVCKHTKHKLKIYSHESQFPLQQRKKTYPFNSIHSSFLYLSQ